MPLRIVCRFAFASVWSALACRGFAVFFWLLCLAVPANGDDEVSLMEFLSLVEAGEQSRLHVVEYDSVATRAFLRSADDTDSVEETIPYEGRAHVRLDQRDGRYHVEIMMATSLYQPDQKSVSTRGAYSLDDTAFRSWMRSADGDALREEDNTEIFGTGTIAPAGDEQQEVQGKGFLQVNAMLTGVCFVPPSFWTLYDEPIGRLSSFLKAQRDKGRPLSVARSTPTIWTVRTVIAMGGDPSTNLAFRYDVERGCVLDAVWSNEPNDTKFQRLQIDYLDVDGLAFPGEVNVVQLLGRPETVRIQFSNPRVDVAAAPGEFRLAFPDNLQLTDKIGRKVYTTGGTMQDEQEAVRQFMFRNRLADTPLTNEDPAATEEKKRSWRWTFLVVNGVLLALAVSYMGIRLLLRLLLLLVLFPCATFGGSVLGGLAEAPADPSGSSWVLSYGEDERITVSQCGVRVAMSLLYYFNRPFEAEDVFSCLPPNEYGVSLADISRLLEAFGLEVSARKGVDRDDIGYAVRSGHAAIVPVAVPTIGNHYLAAMRDAKGDPVCVDVLRAVVPLDHGMPLNLRYFEGLVVFVRDSPESARSSMVDRCRVDPPEVELGEFEVTGDGSVYMTRTFFIENTGRVPVVLSSIRTTCGCTIAQVNRGLLSPNDRVQVPLRVQRGAWGEGRRSKWAEINFADGSKQLVEIKGEGMSPPRAQGIVNLPEHLRLDVSPLLGPDMDRVVTTDVTMRYSEPGRVKLLEVDTDVPWLTALVASQDDGEGIAVVRLTVEQSDAIRKAFVGANTEAQTKVRLSTHGGSAPASIRVIAYRRPFWKVDKHFASMTRTSTANGDRKTGATFLISLEDQRRGPLSVLSTSVAPEGLSIATSMFPDGATISVYALPQPEDAIGVYRLNVRLSSQDGEVGTVLLIVQVAE